MAAALAEFARRADPDGSKLLVVLVDNAGWHVAKRLEVPPNVVLHRLPPRTPESQPAEPLWPLLREVVANEAYDDLEVLERPLIGRCRWLIDHPEVVRGAVGFGWAVALNGEPSRQFRISPREGRPQRAGVEASRGRDRSLARILHARVAG